MERILIFLLLVGTGFAVPAQKTLDKKYALKSGQSVSLDLKYATNIKVTAWDKSELQMKVSVSLQNGKANEAWDIKSTEANNELKISSEIDEAFMKKFWNDYEKNNPDYQNTKNYHSTSEIVYEIFVPKSVTLCITTYSGDIDLLGLTGKVYAKSLSGFIDMNWDKKQAASITLKSISGEVYSNLELNIQNLKENPYVGYALKGKLKGGGTDVHLESISNNVYLRER